MKCFDCATLQLATEAVAICATCGAGMCTDHAIQGHAEESHYTMGNPAVSRLAGRRLFCRACADAYVAGDATLTTLTAAASR